MSEAPSKLDIALALSQKGFHVFPLNEGKKTPAINNWQHQATDNAERIADWWTCPVMEVPNDRNIGICTTRYGKAKALVVVDVDRKNGKNGDMALLDLACDGFDLPPTLEGETPTGGSHLIFWWDKPLNHRKAGYLGEGVDVRSRGGFIVGPGSTVEAGTYRWKGGAVAKAPQWLVDKLGEAQEPAKATSKKVETTDSWATQRAQELLAQAEMADEGTRNDSCYRMAAQFYDLGLPEPEVQALMFDWNLDCCSPPLDPDELERTVASVYRSARSPQGSAHPAAEFEATEAASPDDIAATEAASKDKKHPFDAMNQEYSLVLAGGGHHILWETTGPDGEADLQHLSESAFHRYLASHTMQVGEKSHPVTKLWMNWKGRRTYKGLVFRPGGAASKVSSDFYNLWQGFAVEPSDKASEKAVAAVAAWHEHARENVCQGDKSLYRWLMNYLAHMVQFPEEKPLTALVIRGGKGTGKDSFIDRVGKILGSHYLMTSNRRYIVGNFNGHMERLLMMVLNEAFWSGDKAAEGQLKDLVTGSTHVIEHKGKEPYSVDNLTRVVVIGNEEWLVPATEDERRWAVFDVGNGRQKDRKFFHDMREGIDNHGGDKLLLHQLLQWKVDRGAVNAAPETAGLADQKIASLDTIGEFWHTCLHEEQIIGTEFDGWPDTVRCDRLYAGFVRYFRERGIRTKVPEQSRFGRRLSEMSESLVRHRKTVDGKQVYVYQLAPIETMREQFCQHLGSGVNWG